MSIERGLVVEAYRRMLGREPESDAIVDDFAHNISSFDELILQMAESAEFGQRAVMRHLRSTFDAPPQQVGVDVDAQSLRLLIERVKREWKRLGENDPYWSVLSDERYRGKQLGADEVAEFLASGRESASLIELFESRARVQVRRGTCFELGCGVGRVTCHLARLFERVVAADISPGNIALCRSNLAALGIDNVDYLLVRELDDYVRQPAFDFLFSVIVLQHNTPPVQKAIIESLFPKIAAGGGCLLQIASELPGYVFDAERHLATGDELIEMHALPMPHVLAALHDCGLIPLEVRPDYWTGLPGSFTYFAVKPSSVPAA